MPISMIRIVAGGANWGVVVGRSFNSATLSTPSHHSNLVLSQGWPVRLLTSCFRENTKAAIRLLTENGTGEVPRLDEVTADGRTVFGGA